ncbi:unnamed protein product [Tuber aestivum]|uniref:Large ribosomal subunit protein mL50 n=1 Tax=Tuber aestivum TaxID=59557 RepID=A0A292PQY1_9PEZI|nr:unnamed protein product [Tuber aestivum]
MRRAIPRIALPVTARPCCRTVCRPTPTTTTTPRHFSTAVPKKADIPIQEVLRRKIWGSEEAPGAPGMPPPAPQIPMVEEPTKEEAEREGYIEESDGRALPVVGLAPGLTEWDVQTFANVTRPPSTEAIHAAMHRAVVEVYTHALNGKPVDTPAVEGSVAEEGFTPRVRIEVRQNGEAVFHYGDTSVEGEVLKLSTGVEGEVVEEGAMGEWLQEGLDGKGWVELGFRGDDIKFAVYKRVYRLTGIRVADPDLNRTKTVADLLTHLVAKPRPTKLFDILITETDLPTLPNVKIVGQRVRPWDRERVIGREQPFEKVVGHTYPFEEARR